MWPTSGAVSLPLAGETDLSANGKLPGDALSEHSIVFTSMNYKLPHGFTMNSIFYQMYYLIKPALYTPMQTEPVTDRDNLGNGKKTNHTRMFL